MELTGQELTNRVKQLEAPSALVIVCIFEMCSDWSALKGVVTFAVFAYLRMGLARAKKVSTLQSFEHQGVDCWMRTSSPFQPEHI